MARYTHRKLKDLRDNPNDLPWDDLRTPISSVRFPAASTPPTPRLILSSFYVDGFSSSTDQTIYFELQMPHRWMEGDAIEAHVHWTIPTSGAGAGAETVCWALNYSWANIGDVFPAATLVSGTADVQDKVQNEHLLTEVAHRIDAEDKRASSVILCSLFRDVSEDNYAAEAYLVSVDFHYRSDSDGSYHEYYKLRDYTDKKGKPKNPFKPGAW